MRALLIALALALSAGAGGVPVFDDAAGDTLSISNAHYRVSFRKSDGAVASIVDASSGRAVATGARDGCLWSVATPPGDHVSACSFSAGGAERFAYRWSAESRTLTMEYTPAVGRSNAVIARVTVTASDEPWVDMAIEIDSAYGKVLDDVAFPSGIAVREAEVVRVLFPILPGVILRPGFFDENRSYVAKYPGEGMFADFLAFELSSGSFALYEVPDGPLRPSWLGVTHDGGGAGDESVIVHSFAARIAPGQKWTSPRMRLRLGAGLTESAEAWRSDSGIGALPSIESRLGALLPRLAGAPFLKVDMEMMRRPFADFEPMLRALPAPSVLHFVGYGPRGFDEDYPDFLPPNSAHGTTEEFAGFVARARAMGHLTMPYTNPTWWDDEGPTLNSLPSPLTIADVSVRRDDGGPQFETFGPRGGYAVSPWHPFVSKRADDRVREVIDELDCDLIFEDQIGARPWIYDANPIAPSPTSYIDGWIDHARRHAPARLGTEQGFDRLVEHEVSFFGCVSAEDGEWTVARFGARNWEVFPFAAIVARDKTLFYFHNMGANPLTKANFRMSLATGTMPVCPLYNPAASVFDLGRGGGLDSDALRISSTLQSRVLSRFATERAESFVWLSPSATRTAFRSVEVIANTDATLPLEVPEGMVAPAGVVARTFDGSMTAGVFTSWSGVPLTGGEHWIVEERDDAGVTLVKPSGVETSIVVRPLPAWSRSTPLEVRAMSARGEQIRTIGFTWTAHGPMFTTTRWVDGREVDHYRIVDPTRAPRRRGVRR